jgi:hypothetical protein
MSEEVIYFTHSFFETIFFCTAGLTANHGELHVDRKISIDRYLFSSQSLDRCIFSRSSTWGFVLL